MSILEKVISLFDGCTLDSLKLNCHAWLLAFNRKASFIVIRNGGELRTLLRLNILMALGTATCVELTSALGSRQREHGSRRRRCVRWRHNTDRFQSLRPIGLVNAELRLADRGNLRPQWILLSS